MSFALRLLDVLVSTALEGTAPAVNTRYKLNGRDILDPSGQPFYIFGMSEGHSTFDTGYFLATDPALYKACNCNFMRLEFHLGMGQTDPTYTYPGSVDLYDVTHPETGYMNPDRLAIVLGIIKAFTDAGILVGLAAHSKYIRVNFPLDATALAQFTAAQVYLCGLPEIRNNPLVIWIEHMNEPDPVTGTSQATLNAFYLSLISAVRAVNPDIISIVGPRGGYATGQLANCYLAGQTNVGYCYDLFVQGAAPDQDANQIQRLGQATDFRTNFNAFVWADQWGGTQTADPTGAFVTSMGARLVAAQMHGAYWEVTAPGTGGGTFQTIQINDGVNPPTINTGQLGEIAAWGASFAALRGVSLN